MVEISLSGSGEGSGWVTAPGYSTAAFLLDARVWALSQISSGALKRAFGHGEHFCPGASLARAEARISFERLLARLDDVQLVDPSALSYTPSFIIRGLNDLPLRFRRRG